MTVRPERPDIAPLPDLLRPEGTASAVAGRVGAAQEAAAHRDRQAAAAQEELRQVRTQADVEAQVADALRA